MASEIITVYTRQSCGPCIATKLALAKAGIVFREVAIEDLSDEQLDAFRESGLCQAPIVVTPSGDAWSAFRPDRIAEL